MPGRRFAAGGEPMPNAHRALKGQTALVTGASGGIGRAIALAFGAAGAAVGVNYLRDRAGAEGVVREIAAKRGKAVALAGDVSDERHVDSMFAALRERFGALDILVANAGVQRDAPIA